MERKRSELAGPKTKRPDLMKNILIWAFYGVGALAIAYLALYAYAAFTGRGLQPGDPIHIFRKPDAPNYSAAPGRVSPALPGYAVAATRL